MENLREAATIRHGEEWLCTTSCGFSVLFVGAGGASEEIPALVEDTGSCTWVKEPLVAAMGARGRCWCTEVTFENY